jgi:gluconokinase
VIIVIMGVTGAGKTTVGSLLAERLGWDFDDGDSFHPASNVEKMKAGVPLDDDDRRPWLESLQAEIERRNASGRNLVLACSALKREYRNLLAKGAAVNFVYLKGSAQLIAERLRKRRGHFADEKILAGQFADLEEPEDSAVVVGISEAPEEVVQTIREKLQV